MLEIDSFLNLNFTSSVKMIFSLNKIWIFSDTISNVKVQ